MKIELEHGAGTEQEPNDKELRNEEIPSETGEAVAAQFAQFPVSGGKCALKS